VDPPTLLEEVTDSFEFRTPNGLKPELLIDGNPLPGFRDMDDPQIAKWKWEKGPFGRIGYATIELRVDASNYAKRLLRVEPRKFSHEDHRGLLDEIARLAYNIIYDLRDSTFERLDLVEPKDIPQSGIEWLEKLADILAKLEPVLYEIDRQPHVRLTS